MFKRIAILLAGLLLMSACAAEDKPAAVASKWTLGKNYFAVIPPQPTATGDKIEVLEVFSYACPHCAHFQPYADQIKAQLPANATFSYMPAIFSPTWEPFARAFYTAQSFGVLDKTHQALFDALHRDHKQFKTIQDLAAFYAGFGVNAESFVSTSGSFVVEGKIAQSLDLVRKYEVAGTPSIIINGKYRVMAGPEIAVSLPDMVEITLMLVKQEMAAKGK
jgi:protein dithiol oxidoreductase (disulfide-forming)